MYSKIIASFLVFSASLPSVFAVPEVVAPNEILPFTGESDPGNVIATIIASAISLTAVLAIIAITWGAMQMILASGEEEKVKKGRMIIIYSFVGLLVAGIAFGVVKLITSIQP